MKIAFLAENVEKFIPLLNKTVPSHSQVPVLSNLFLEAGKTGFSISATDLEIGARIKIPAKIEEEGALTVPGKQFTDILTSFVKGKVIIEKEKDNVVVYHGEDKIVFQTIPKEEFPNLFMEKGEKTYVFKKGEFREIFSKLIFSVSYDETRPALTGVFIEQKNEATNLVATDGYRMSVKKIEGSKLIEKEGRMIVSGRILGEAMSLKEEGEMEMYVYKGGNQVLFESGGVVIVGRLIEGEFPNYEKVIPVSNKTKISIDREEFLKAIKLSSVFARESANIVKLKIEKNNLYLFSKSSGLGEGEIKIKTEQEGEDNEISFNIKFLLDLLRNIEDEYVVMEMNSPLESALFRIEKDNNFLHVIMPVRVQD